MGSSRNGFVSSPAKRRRWCISAVLLGQCGFALASFGFDWVRFVAQSQLAAQLRRSTEIGHFRTFPDIGTGDGHS